MAKDSEQKIPSNTAKSQIRTEEKQTSLTAAKDRAQLTATTAMSVVHVALLKSVIDGGHGANRYYTVVIVLIVIALAVQVVTGIIAIFVTHTRNYYAKYSSDMCSECASDCFSCCLKVAPQRVNTPAQGDDAGSQGDGARAKRDAYICQGKPSSEVDDGSRNGVAAAGDLSLSMTSLKTLTALDAVTAEGYEFITVQLLQAEFDAINASAELVRLKRQLTKETNRHEDVTKASEARQEEVESSDMNKGLEDRENEGDGNERDTSKPHTRLQNIEVGIANCEATIRHLEVLQLQEKLVSGYADDIQMNNIMKKVTYWQSAINYLLYVVFICNAFITALGVTSGQGGISSGSGAVTGGSGAVTGGN